MLDPPSASEMLAVETAVSEPILTLVDFIQETALVCLMRPIKEVLSFLASLSQVKVAWIFPFGGISVRICSDVGIDDSVSDSDTLHAFR
jgi:hypothetical protein